MGASQPTTKDAKTLRRDATKLALFLLIVGLGLISLFLAVLFLYIRRSQPDTSKDEWLLALNAVFYLLPGLGLVILAWWCWQSTRKEFNAEMQLGEGVSATAISSEGAGQGPASAFELTLRRGEEAAQRAQSLGAGQFWLIEVEEHIDATQAVLTSGEYMRAAVPSTLVLAVEAFRRGGALEFKGENAEKKWLELNRITQPAILFVPRETLPLLKRDAQLWSRVAGVS